MISIISFLPEEIILDIFSRLPAKSIGRCRCVSKPWRAFLSQRCFTKTKFSQQCLILVSDTGSLFTAPLTDVITEPLRELSFMSHPGSWDSIFAVCDGLVLLVDNASDIFLVNPVTREIRGVPHLPFGPNIKDCYNKYGVGYDSVNDDYKIVILSYYRPCLAPDNDDDEEEDGVDIYDKVFVNVFSTKNGAWNEAGCSPYDHGHDDSPIPGVFVNGYIHWIAFDVGGYLIAAFDLVTERFNVVPSPKEFRLSNRSDLVEFGGDLCVYKGTDYWIMKEYGTKDSWIQVKLNVEEEDIRPLCMLRERQIWLVKDEDSYEEAKLVKYDLDEEILRDVVIDDDSDESKVRGTFAGVNEGCNGPRFCRATFVESLVSPYRSRTIRSR